MLAGSSLLSTKPKQHAQSLHSTTLVTHRHIHQFFSATSPFQPRYLYSDAALLGDQSDCGHRHAH